ncbi:MAG: DUF3574 domain-containing protein [Eubacteriales bacterium]|nr:DUF3574 domain-containing protein [Eubacteriales bacterium]
MKRKSGNLKRNLALVLMCALVVIAGGCGSEKTVKNENHTENSDWMQDAEYIVYFGLNDKSTGEQIVSKEEATETIKKIFEKQGVGYTVLDAFGAYLDDEGKVVSNETVVLDILMVSEEELESAVTEAVDELHLASAMVTKSDVSYRFYTTD